ncbi:type II toxin-antitoxin system MqsA family antitoxin [Sulfuricurvum sp.]|uniref:type II toxin-antitoxin system MqsA family antitoxin n=1 Tax=Sulfuricurvum sp. TaxID=2025608 RepID=UPI00262D2188|nr:type II toxin-antitoxin system MqsA family antitoxin [Sulfuricurvum sp.]MDD2782249.1 type II toxin-antitoxin system MqsA family antitoxin [Sulfuricurvum sp.]
MRLEECPYCNGELEYNKHTEELKYKGKTLFIDMVGEYCPACQEGFQNDEDLKTNEHTIALAKTAADKKIASDIARIRKNLGLSQTEASEIFGGGIRAFHKYEKGEISPPQTLVILFDLLDKGTVTLDAIKENATQKIA